LFKSTKIRFVIVITILAIAGGMISMDLSSDTRSTGLAANPPADQSKPAIWAVKGEVLVTNRLDIDFSKYMVTFMELGADRCIPCKKMQPIMKEIAAAFPDRVQVIFYDVWKDPAPGEKYGIQLIPTQVFVDQMGKEIARHVGLFPKEEILALLKKHGIQ
jgi:thioredoxin 1